MPGIKRKTPELNPMMRRVAECLANPEYTKNISEMLIELDVPRSTFYKWFETDTGFREYVDKLIDKYTDSELGRVWSAVISSACRGDVQAQKLYFELKNKYKQNIDLSGKVVIIGGEDDIAD